MLSLLVKRFFHCSAFGGVSILPTVPTFHVSFTQKQLHVFRNVLIAAMVKGGCHHFALVIIAVINALVCRDASSFLPCLDIGI